MRKGRELCFRSKNTIVKQSTNENWSENIESSRDKSKQAKAKHKLHTGNTDLDTTDFSSGTTEGKEKLEHLSGAETNKPNNNNENLSTESPTSHKIFFLNVGRPPVST